MLNREELIAFLEKKIQILGKRQYKINLTLLDTMSLHELANLLNNLSNQVYNSNKKNTRISNRCVFLCLEQDNSGETNTKLLLCQSDEVNDKYCSFLHDDAKYTCPHYKSS